MLGLPEEVAARWAIEVSTLTSTARDGRIPRVTESHRAASESGAEALGGCLGDAILVLVNASPPCPIRVP